MLPEKGCGLLAEVPLTMTVEEFASFTMAHPVTVRKKCKGGELPCMKAGRRYVIYAREYVAQTLRGTPGAEDGEG